MASAMKTNQSASVLHEIYSWSIGRPGWQCDALRRIITKTNLDAADRTELENLCRQTPGAVSTTGVPLVAVPLGPEHLPAGPNAQASVSIEYLDNLTGVNRLPSGQKVVFGQAPGLTVIYGDNGTGKSGYVRVIKKACRTRGAPPVIQPDAFSSTQQKPTCKIGIKTTAGSKEVTWTDGTPGDEALANVFVFDTAAADHYLTSDGPASFTPYGLDVLLKLAKICDVIGANIKGDIDKLKQEIVAGKMALEKYPNTAIGSALLKLNNKSSTANLMALGGLSDTESKRLADLQVILSSNPKQKAQQTRAAKNRIDAFKTRLEENAVQLAPDKVKELKECFENAVATADAAKSSVDNRFAKGVLVGTGTPLWRALWEAAREFSTETAYPQKSFPYTDGDARCVLCQRPFENDTEAATLAHCFEKFCQDDVQKAEKLARKKLTDTTKLFSGKSSLKSDFEKLATDISGLKPVELKLLNDFVVAADDRLASVKNAIEANKWSAPGDLTASPSSVLATLINALETRAKTEESAEDPKARAILESEREELTAKDWIKSVKAEIDSQIDRYQRLEVLNTRLEDTKTNSITTKNSTLTKELVTEAYCNRFADEIKGLGVRTVKVKLEELSSTKGEKKFGIRLEGVTCKINIQEIVSEGEQRCISLAAFLAELSQSSHHSTLVFDDPVCSLDHHYRSRIAGRLVKEAKVRQVIVFTHDTVFLNDLLSEADENGIPFSPNFLRWDTQKPGRLEPGLPWDCKSPEDRLDKLEKAHKALEKIWHPHPTDELQTQMRNQYSDLRATIERIVEKVVFADVVFRFRSYVSLKNLNEVVGFPDSENTEIQRLFKKCCNVTGAHDAPAGKQAPVPDPAELAQDIEATKKLLETIRARRKAARVT
jgi:hypothetical protein